MGRFRTFLLVAACVLAIALAGKGKNDGPDTEDIDDNGYSPDEDNVEHVSKKPEPTDTEDHLPPLFPMSSHTLFGVFVACIGLIIAAGGGIGGGGVLVPVFIMVCSFPAKLAIPLSNVTIFGGAISNCYLNLQKRHPLADRPLVDFDLVNVMEPLTIAGAVVGSLLNKMLPGWLITIMLVIVLGATGAKTLSTGIKRWNKESEELANGSGDASNSGSTSVQLQNMYGSTGSSSTPDLNNMDFNELRRVARDLGAEEKQLNMAWDRAELLQIIKTAQDPEPQQKIQQSEDHELQMILEEEKQIPWNKILFLVICFVGVVSFSLLRGDTEGHGPLGLQCGSFWYMILLLAPLPWIGMLATYQRKVLLEQHAQKLRLNYYERYPIEGDIQWDEKSTVVYPLICSLSGMFAGLFGIGGGIVKGPLMLEMGIHPQVSSGTAAFMILFTAGSASVSFALFGLLQLDYAIFFFIVGLIFTYVGQLFSNWAISKGGRSSIIIFIIATIIIVSTILMGIEGYHSAHQTWKHHTTAHLGLCGGGGGGE